MACQRTVGPAVDDPTGTPESLDARSMAAAQVVAFGVAVVAVIGLRWRRRW
jgi:hypothetical protein